MPVLCQQVQEPKSPKFFVFFSFFACSDFEELWDFAFSFLPGCRRHHMRWVLTFLVVVITVVISILSIVAASKNLQLLLKETETCTESALRNLE